MRKIITVITGAVLMATCVQGKHPPDSDVQMVEILLPLSVEGVELQAQVWGTGCPDRPNLCH